MLKRKDGSVSPRGLWDNIRANKGSGKKPTASMLKQEKVIKSQTKKNKDIGNPSKKSAAGNPVVLPPTRVQSYTIDKTNNGKKNFKEFVKTSSADGNTQSLSVSNNKRDKNYFFSTNKKGSSLSITKRGREKITTGAKAERKFSRAVRKNT